MHHRSLRWLSVIDRVKQMLDDQQEQLRIHAAAVRRAEQRSLQLKAAKAPPITAQSAAASSDLMPARLTDSAASPLATHVPLSTANDSAVIPSTAVSSLGTASVLSAEPSGFSVAAAAVVPHSPTDLLCSWTGDLRLSTIEPLRSPGRVKFGTILKVTRRFLSALSPQSPSVSQSGSHQMYHFADRGPVTPVLKHRGGSRTAVSADTTARSSTRRCIERYSRRSQ